jgi:hypothetical protein
MRSLARRIVDSRVLSRRSLFDVGLSALFDVVPESGSRTL